MDVNDLRELLNEESPQGLDGGEMLAFAQRARTRRRVTAVGSSLAAVVTAVALVFGVGQFNRNNDPAPATASPSIVASTTPEPATPTETEMTTAHAGITGICESSSHVDFTNQTGLFAASGGARLKIVVTHGKVQALDSRTRVLQTLPEGAEVLVGATDGTHAAYLLGTDTAIGGSSMDLMYWNGQGEAKRLALPDTTVLTGDLQVNDGYAMFATGGEEGSPQIHLLNLVSGEQKVVHNSEYGGYNLLPGGKYVIQVPSPDGMSQVGAVSAPGGPDGSKLAMYAPVHTNGRAWVFNDDNAGENPKAATKIWQPATMTAPVTVFTNEGMLAMGGAAGHTNMGKNFALIYQNDSAYHLVDLRTGGRLKLPTSNGSPSYRLTPDDVLLRNALPGTSGWDAGSAAHADLAGVSLRC